MKTKLIIIPFIMILLSLSIFATNTEYNKLGYNELADFYSGDFADFTNTSTDDESFYKVIDNRYGKTTPKTTILDDGVKYIIAYSSPNINIYQYDGTTFSIIDGYQIESGTTYLDGDFVIHEKDNMTYIVYPTKSATSTTLYINFLTYNGTFTHSDFNITSTITKSCTDRYKSITSTYSETFTGCPTSIQCNDEFNICAGVWQTTPFKYAVTTFNTTGIIGYYIQNASYDPAHVPYNHVALPSIPTLILQHIDTDGLLDIVFSYANYVGAVYRPKLASFDISATTSNVTLDWQTELRNFNDGGSGYVCRDDGGVYNRNNCAQGLSGVTAIPFDGVSANGLELFVSVWNTKNNFMMYQVASVDGSITDTHSEIMAGYYVSNVARLDCFEETAGIDAGIMVFNNVTNQINFFCAGSGNFIFGLNDCEFNSYTQNFTDFQKYGYGNMITSLETDGTIQDEILTQFGVFDLDFPSTLTCSSALTKTYTWSDKSISAYAVDYEVVERNDMIFSSSSLLGYIDDGYTNQNAYISRLTFNPCTTESGALTSWQYNETARITIRAIDPETNDVQVRVLMYYNSVYETDSGWTNLSTSGFDVDVEVTPLTIIGIGTIRVMARDGYHSTYDYEDTYFSVADGNDTVTFGDCITIAGYEPTTEDNETIDEEGTDINDNAVVNGLRTFSEPMGLSIAIIYIIFMVLVAVAVMFADMGEHTGLKFALIGFIEVLMIIIGVKLTIFGVGTLIILVIGGLVLLIPFIRRIFTGASE